MRGTPGAGAHDARASPNQAPDCVKTPCFGRLYHGARSRETFLRLGSCGLAWVLSTARPAPQPSCVQRGLRTTWPQTSPSVALSADFRGQKMTHTFPHTLAEVRGT